MSKINLAEAGEELRELILEMTCVKGTRERYCEENQLTLDSVSKNFKVIGKGDNGGIIIRNAQGIEFEKFPDGRLTRLTDMG